jgi:sugar lactone lactonase YvrE
VYIVERNGNALRAVDKSGRIRTVIGAGQNTPPLNGPKHLAIDREDNVILVDTENHLIRRYNPRDNTLTTIAGTGSKGDGVEPADPLKTGLSRPHGAALAPNGDLYISDSDNHRIIRIQP